MPLTFPAHQGLIVPIKLRWPRAIDGTALCIGAAAPDPAYALGPWLNSQSHTAIGVVVWALPFTLAVASLVRWRAASGIFAALPDLGRLRLRSYRVLGTRRPSAVVTTSSALLGATSHTVVDGFTHRNRFGSNWLGLNDVLFTVPIAGDRTAAGVLQYIGHFGGTVVFVAALVSIANSGRLEDWYGDEAVSDARDVSLGRSHRAAFWTAVVLPTAVTACVLVATGRPPIFLPLTVLIVTLVINGVILGRGLELRFTHRQR